MKAIYQIKAAYLVIHYGLKSINLYALLGVMLIVFSGMMIVSAFSPDNPIRFLCVCVSVFSLYFANYLILKFK